MRRNLTIILAIAIASVFLAGTPAKAQGGGGGTCLKPDPTTGLCIVWGTGGGTGGNNGTPVSNPHTGGDGKTVCSDGGQTIPCTYNGGWWDASQECYVKAATPAPPKSDPVWNGHKDGAIYVCFGGGMGRAGLITRNFWSATPPAGPGAVDPAQLARQAIASMKFHAITIGIVPQPGAISRGLVGLPVWMWVAQPGPNTVGPLNAQASAGGVTVTANATLDNIVWSMGDGHSVTCSGAGTPYDSSDRMSPDCGYRYSTTSTNQPGGVFPISATSNWTVTWAGGGQTGTIPLTFTANTAIRVGEAEVVVTR